MVSNSNLRGIIGNYLEDVQPLCLIGESLPEFGGFTLNAREIDLIFEQTRGIKFIFSRLTLGYEGGLKLASILPFYPLLEEINIGKYIYILYIYRCK